MQVLPGVVGGVRPRRMGRLTGAVAAALALLALAGCARFDAALGQRQAVVTFTTSATKAQKLSVRSACATVPNVTPQAVPSTGSSPYALQELTFEIDHASDANVAQLEKCLNRFPAVVAGVTLQDSSDDS